MMKKILLLLLSLCCLTVYANATETTQDLYGTDTLTEALPEAAQNLADDFSPGNSVNIRSALQKILSSITEALPDLLKSTLREVRALLVIAILCGIAGSLTETTGHGTAVVRLCGIAATAAAMLNQNGTLTAELQDTIEKISTFAQCLLPVLTAAGAAAGAGSSAGTHGALALFLCGTVLRFLSDAAVKAVFCYIALQLAAAIAENGMLGKLAEMVKGTLTTTLRTVLTIFLTILGMSGLLSGSVNAAALKTMRIGLSTGLPMVGSVMADAAESVLLGARLVRNTAGTFGVLVIFATAALPLVRLGIRWLFCRMVSAAMGFCGIPPLERLTEGLAEASGMLLGLAGTCTLLTLIATFTGMLLGGIS